MMRWSIAAPLVLVAATGCLATKSDIALLQAETRASRAQSAQGDSSILRADSERRAQIDRLLAEMTRTNDSLRVLAARLAAFQANVNGQLSSMGEQLVTVQERLGQTTANLQDQRRQLEQLREQGMAAVSAPAAAPPVVGDTSRHIPPGTPGPAVLYNTAIQQLRNGSFRVARTGFELLVNSYPDYESVPAATLKIGEAYQGEGNPTAADSVYQLVVTKYPKTDEAATALYRRGKILLAADKKAEARAIFNRVIAEYPRSDAAALARTAITP
jgi:tol-pal system protein YbgF